MENDGKEFFKKEGILVPASAITSLAVGSSRSLRDWTEARGVVASAAAEVANGQIAIEQGDKSKGLEHFRKATQLDPNNIMAWFQLGGGLLGMGRDSEAMEALRKALALKPQIPEALLGIGTLFEKRQQYPQAIEAYESALRMNPNSDRIRFSLGSAYLLAEQTEKAKEQCEALKLMNPEAAAHLSGLIQRWDALVASTVGIADGGKGAAPMSTADRVSRLAEPILATVRSAAKEGTLNKEVALKVAVGLSPFLNFQFSKIGDQDTEAVLSCYLNTVSEIHRLAMTSRQITAVERLEIINVGLAGISQLLSSHGVTPTQALSVKRITGDSIVKSLQAEVFMGNDLDHLMGSIPGTRSTALLREMGIYESTLQSTKTGKK